MAARVTIILILLSYVLCCATEDNGDRIIGGRNSAISEAPHQVSLQRLGIHSCGGSIYSPTVIITAAHCIKTFLATKLSVLSVRAGSTLWDSGGVVKKIENMLMHPRYNSTSKAYDVGLIKVDSPFVYSKSIQPIRLACGVPKDGKFGYISGWGYVIENGISIPNKLQMAKVKAISRSSCSSNRWEYGNRILGPMICANGEGIDACQGDSGGPYVSASTGKLWGVVSWGEGCGHKEYPGVFTAIAAVRNWIHIYAKTM